MAGWAPPALSPALWPTQNRSILPVAGERTMNRFQTLADGAPARTAVKNLIH